MVSHLKGITKEEARVWVKAVGLITWDPKGKEGPSHSRPEKTIDESISQVYQKNLWQDAKVRTRAIREFGWSDETMRLEGIGFDNRTQRYTFPVHNSEGALVNFRMYSPDAAPGMKVISWTDGEKKAGYGRARIYPAKEMSKSILILVEGEKDRTLMAQVLRDNGADEWGCVTGTGG